MYSLEPYLHYVVITLVIKLHSENVFQQAPLSVRRCVKCVNSVLPFLDSTVLPIPSIFVPGKEINYSQVLHICVYIIICR